MEPNQKLVAFFERYQGLQQYSVCWSKLIEDLLLHTQEIESALRNENQQLRSQLDEAKLDLSSATTSRRQLQTELEEKQAKMKTVSRRHSQLQARNPYVTILIDGDGLIFKEKWIRQGIDGGKKAAYALREAIAEHCDSDEEEEEEEVEISCKIVANLEGLSRAMVRGGYIASERIVKDFTLGFTQAKASFDFIDVGHGKERADSKIKETTRWHLQNHNCKHIFLGISHDAGYAPFLDEVFQDAKVRGRISIVEGVATVRDLRRVTDKVILLDDELFRTEKLVERSTAMPTPSISPQSPTLSNSSSTGTGTSTKSSPFFPWIAAAQKLRPASPPPKLTIPLAPKTDHPGRKTNGNAKPAWNPGPRGLDRPIQVSASVLDNIKQRKDHDKLCNNHYLRGPSGCFKEGSCNYVHDYNASGEEIKAIAVLTRQNPCDKGQDCTDEECIYGHHCPTITDGVCYHPYCKFPIDAHPPGTKFKNPKIEFNFL